MQIVGVLIRSIITPLRIKDPRKDSTARGHPAPKGWSEEIEKPR